MTVWKITKKNELHCVKYYTNFKLTNLHVKLCMGSVHPGRHHTNPLNLYRKKNILLYNVLFR